LPVPPAGTPYGISFLADRGHTAELAFGVNRWGINNELSVTIGRRKCFIARDKSVFVIRGSGDLLRNRTSIERAIGLAQGGRVTYRIGFFKSKLELNFARDVDVMALGRIYEDDRLMGDFFERYVAYENGLRGVTSRRHRLAISYFIDGCAGLPSLEQKALSIFTALEILDGADTLEKNAVKDFFGVKLEEAECLINVRNALTHEGVGLFEAIKRAHATTRTHKRLWSLPFRMSGVSKSWVSGHVQKSAWILGRDHEECACCARRCPAALLPLL
jgi:hypothetical protein